MNIRIYSELVNLSNECPNIFGRSHNWRMNTRIYSDLVNLLNGRSNIFEIVQVYRMNIRIYQNFITPSHPWPTQPDLDLSWLLTFPGGWVAGWGGGRNWKEGPPKCHDLDVAKVTHELLRPWRTRWVWGLLSRNWSRSILLFECSWWFW